MKLRQIKAFSELRAGMPIRVLGSCIWCGREHKYRRILLALREGVVGYPKKAPKYMRFWTQTPSPVCGPTSTTSVTDVTVTDGRVYEELDEDQQTIQESKTLEIVR